MLRVRVIQLDTTFKNSILKITISDITLLINSYQDTHIISYCFKTMIKILL